MFYLVPASLVFAFCTTMLCLDTTASKVDSEAWVLVVLAALLWPITLPSILRKQYLNLRQWYRVWTNNSHAAITKPLADI
jgi:hypothetical protein